jgi:hypothetical protein
MIMADANGSSGSNTGLAFIVGGLLVAVAVLAVVLIGGGVVQMPGANHTNVSRSVNLTVPAPAPKINLPSPPAVVPAPEDAPASPANPPAAN